MDTKTSELVAKVPRVTLVFWIIKIFATTLGETGGDAATMSWLGETTDEAKGTGYLIGTAIFGVIDPTAHAEIVAIRDACRALQRFDLRGCVLYTSCEPCPMCLYAIYWARLDRVYFASTRKDAAGIGFDDDFISAKPDNFPALHPNSSRHPSNTGTISRPVRRTD